MCESYSVNLYGSFFLPEKLYFDDVIVDKLSVFFSNIDEFEICHNLKKIKFIRYNLNQSMGF